MSLCRTRLQSTGTFALLRTAFESRVITLTFKLPDSHMFWLQLQNFIFLILVDIIKDSIKQTLNARLKQLQAGHFFVTLFFFDTFA